MICLLKKFIFIALLFISIFAFGQEKFEVSLKNRNAHYIDITYKTRLAASEKRTLSFATWIPGSYKIREFSKNIVAFSSPDDFVSLRKKNKYEWEISASKTADITLKYRYYAFEVSVRTSYIDSEFAMLNPINFIPLINHKKDSEYILSFRDFEGLDALSTALNVSKNREVSASSFEALADNPIIMGEIDEVSIGKSSFNTQYHLSILNEGNYDRKEIQKDLFKIVETAEKMFGGSPNKNYKFLHVNLGRAGGGLEHDSCTIILKSPNGFAQRDEYVDYLDLMAHEHFHLWNVRRLRPKGIEVYDLHNENYVEELWFAEGVTTYYAKKLMFRAGVISQDEFFHLMETEIEKFEPKHGKNIQSLRDASFDAWIKFYLPNENSHNTSVSYYSKGAVVAFLLDAMIMRDTNYKKSFDDVVVQMYEKFYIQEKKGYTNRDILEMINTLTGKDYSDFFEKYIYGTVPLDYKMLKGLAGLEVQGVWKENQKEIGIKTKEVGRKVVISKISESNPAFSSGLSVHDVIISVDGKTRKHKKGFEKIIGKKTHGETAEFQIKRRGKPLSFEVQIEKAKIFDSKIIPNNQSDIFKKYLQNLGLK